MNYAVASALSLLLNEQVSMPPDWPLFGWGAVAAGVLVAGLFGKLD